MVNISLEVKYKFCSEQKDDAPFISISHDLFIQASTYALTNVVKNIPYTDVKM